MEQPIATYVPLPWQVGPWKDLSPVLLLTGSGGGGKSRLAAERCHAFCMRYPRSTVLVLRKNREAMSNSTILFLERVVIGNDPRVRHLPSKHRFEYSNGSVIVYGGMANDEQREQIRSVGAEGGVDLAWMEEATAFQEADFNEVLARMRGQKAPWRQVMLTTNPGAPSHWIYQRLIGKGEASVYYSKAADNHHNPEDYQANLERMTGVQYLRLAKGMWVQAEGVVYEDFDRSVHVIPRFEIPKHWRRIRVVDFGYTNPFVCSWWAVDDDGRVYLYREIYHTRRIVEDHAKQIKALSKGEHIEATIADHDAEDRATLEKYGVPTLPAHKALMPGIQAVQARLRKAGDDKPRLFFLEDSLVERDDSLPEARRPWCTEQEFESYVWPKGTDGKPLKEVPVKENDHGADATRYLCAYVDGLGKLSLHDAVSRIAALTEPIADVGGHDPDDTWPSFGLDDNDPFGR